MDYESDCIQFDQADDHFPSSFVTTGSFCIFYRKNGKNKLIYSCREQKHTLSLWFSGLRHGLIKVAGFVAGLMKNMQPDRDSNPGPFAIRANALPTELSELPTYNSSDYIQVHSRYNMCRREHLCLILGNFCDFKGPKVPDAMFGRKMYYTQ